MRHAILIVLLLFLLFLPGCTQDNPPAITNVAIPDNAPNISMPAIGLPVVEYYYSSKCSACKELAPLISEVKNYFDGKVDFREFDISEPQGLAEFDKFATGNGISKRYVPVIKIGNVTLTGLGEIKRANLYSALFNYTNQSGGT